jgi:hypothetical protein
MNMCRYPGCSNPAANERAHCNWCDMHRVAIRNSRPMRRIARAAIKSLGLPDAARVKSPNPYDHRLPPRKRSEGPMRPAEKKCNQCYDMPWARTNERRNTMSGDSAAEGSPVVGPNGLCLGCGLPYEPEPRPELCGTVRSSAGICVDHGLVEGIPVEFRGRRSDGKRKQAK